MWLLDTPSICWLVLEFYLQLAVIIEVALVINCRQLSKTSYIECAISPLAETFLFWSL